MKHALLAILTTLLIVAMTLSAMVILVRATLYVTAIQSPLPRAGAMAAELLLGVVLLLVASTSGLTACSQRYGYLHHPPTENTGTTPGTYNVTVTAYSNNGGEVTSHTLPITLTVK